MTKLPKSKIDKFIFSMHDKSFKVSEKMKD